MSEGISVKVFDGDVQALLADLRFDLQGKGMQKIVGQGVARLFRDHLHRLNDRRHRGLTMEGFYARAAKSVHWFVKGDGIMIGITQRGFRLRLLGGTVRPGKSISKATGRPTTRLTIPNEANPIGVGRRAGELDLVPVWGSRGPFALIERQHGERELTADGRIVSKRIDKSLVTQTHRN